jgi:hypothetical protein
MDDRQHNGLEKENEIPTSITLLQKDGLRIRGMHLGAIVALYLWWDV